MSADQTLKILAEDLVHKAHMMLGLHEDLRRLAEHVRAEDHDAILWRARRILESLLGHAMRINGEKPVDHADLDAKVRQAGLGELEKVAARAIQQFGNRGVHGRSSDVYAEQPVAGREAASLICLNGIAMILTWFVDRHPPPPGVLHAAREAKPATVPPPRAEAASDAEEESDGGIDDVIEVDLLESLGRMTVATARDQDLAPTIAKLTGLTQRKIQNRLDDADPRTRVENVFALLWGSPDVLGKVTVSTARRCGLLPWLSEFLLVEPETVREQLGAAHGKTHLRSLFEDEWVSAENRGEEEEADDASADLPTYDDIGACTLSQLERGESTWILSHLTGLSEVRVRNRLRGHGGRTLVRNAFPEWDDPAVVGRMTAKRARLYKASGWIARYVGMKEATVLSKLDAAAGKAHVRTVFSDRWE